MTRQQAYDLVKRYANTSDASELKKPRAVLLLWFLKNVYGLDDLDAYEFVCDGDEDQGIDGLYLEPPEADDDTHTLTLFQAKYPLGPTQVGPNDLKNFVAYRDAAPAWAMFVGSGSHYYAALELGAAGGILAVANLAATIAVGLHEAFVAGDKTRAGAAQERLTPLNRAAVAEHGVAGVKAAMDIVGLAGGRVRAPLSDLADAERDSLRRMLRAAGLGKERAGDV